MIEGAILAVDHAIVWSKRSFRKKMQDYWIKESIKDRPFDDFYELGKELGKLVYIMATLSLFTYSPYVMLAVADMATYS